MTLIQPPALPNGPYRLDGYATILDRDGRPIPDRRSPAHLCRRGQSADEPFCDGSHASTGWKEHA